MLYRYGKIPTTDVTRLRQVAEAVTFIEAKSIRRRVGANGINNLSVYNYSRWYRWPNRMRQHFKACHFTPAVEKALVGWFLDIPAGGGFLDRMITWIDKPMAGTVIAVSLQDDQRILINEEEHIVNEGEIIGFSLRCVHEIKPSVNGQKWANIMVYQTPETFQ